jgi:hypothetical protein
MIDTENLSKRQVVTAAFLTGILIGIILSQLAVVDQEHSENPAPSSEEELPEPYPTLEDSDACPPRTSCVSQAPFRGNQLPERQVRDEEVIRA